MLGCFGQKMGMTQKFMENGDATPVTVIKCGPCTVTQKKTSKKEGYSALQLGFKEEEKVQRVNRPQRGHFKKAKTGVFRRLGELRSEKIDDINVGDVIDVKAFQVGDLLNVRGMVKGRGFQGNIKRHNQSGGGASHGSHFHRSPGSIGMCQDPGRVIKGTRLPGHMGTNFVTTKRLKIVEIDVENNLLFVTGAIAGANGGYLQITTPGLDFSDRVVKEAAPKEEPAKEVDTEEVKAEEAKTEETKQEAAAPEAPKAEKKEEPTTDKA